MKRANSMFRLCCVLALAAMPILAYAQSEEMTGAPAVDLSTQSYNNGYYQGLMDRDDGKTLTFNCSGGTEDNLREYKLGYLLGYTRRDYYLDQKIRDVVYTTDSMINGFVSGYREQYLQQSFNFSGLHLNLWVK